MAADHRGCAWPEPQYTVGSYNNNNCTGTLSSSLSIYEHECKNSDANSPSNFSLTVKLEGSQLTVWYLFILLFVICTTIHFNL